MFTLCFDWLINDDEDSKVTLINKEITDKQRNRWMTERASEWASKWMDEWTNQRNKIKWNEVKKH